MIRDLVYYRHYFEEFYNTLPHKVREKYRYVLYIIQNIPKVPEKFLKQIEGTKGLYKIRVEFESNIYRNFCFFDAGRLVILLNGFQKKTQKTPKNEIDLAERLMKEYFENK